MISPESKMHTSDRVLLLELVDDKKPMNSIGMIDTRLFKDGENANRLHAKMDTDSCLWSLHYEKGAIPAALKGTFTGFRALKKYADNYFEQRNIKITEVKG